MKESQNTSNTVGFQNEKMTFSKFQALEIKPLYMQKWQTNGVNNQNYQVIKDAYDDSPTNSSIINAMTNYFMGNGLIDKNGLNVTTYLSKFDLLLAIRDYKLFGGCTLQVIKNLNGKPLKIKHIPCESIGLNLDLNTMEVNGYWYSYDWTLKGRFRPVFYPKFGSGKPLEILMIKRPSSNPFFPIPDYLSGIPYAQMEGEMANAGINHFKNSMSALTVINVMGKTYEDPSVAEIEGKKIKDKAVGTDNTGRALVQFAYDMNSAITVDQLHPPELNQQNVFFAEESERKILASHSVPAVLFGSGSQGSGFSSNADEIAVATKGLYRRHINPNREVLLEGLMQIFKEINSSYDLDFEDFKEEEQITTAE